MPDSINFANDPNAMNQQGVPMQGWDPNQYAAQMQDPQSMQAQAMYGNQAYQGYADPNAQYMPQQGGMYYPDDASLYGAYGYAEEDPERIARQQQVRAASNFGLKSHSAQQPQPVDYAAQAQQADMAAAQAQQAQQAQMAQQAALAQQQVQPSMQQPQQQMYQQPQMAQPAQMPYTGEPPKDSNAVLGLILGILSIVFAVIPPIGIVLGFFSTHLSKKFRRAGGDTAVGDSARIFGRVGLIFSIVMFFAFAFVITYVAGATFGNYGARAIAIYFNNSPLGQIFGIIPLAS